MFQTTNQFWIGDPFIDHNWVIIGYFSTFQWEFQDPKNVGTRYHMFGLFLWVYPLSPYIGLTYGRYLQ